MNFMQDSKASLTSREEFKSAFSIMLDDTMFYSLHVTLSHSDGGVRFSVNKKARMSPACCQWLVVT